MPGLAGIGESGAWTVELDEPGEVEEGRCAQFSRHSVLVQVVLENFDQLHSLAEAILPGYDVNFSLDTLGGELHVVIMEERIWLRMLVPCRDGSTQLFEAWFDAKEAPHLAEAIKEAVQEAEEPRKGR